MAINDSNKLAIASKRLTGKAHTSQGLEDYGETIGSNIQIDNTTIFVDVIPSVLPENPIFGEVVGGCVQYVEFSVEPIAGTDSVTAGRAQGYKLKLPGDYADNLSYNITNPKAGTAPFLNGATLGDSFGRLQIVPPKYAPFINGINPYVPKLEDGSGGSIPLLSDIDWNLDTYAGTLFVQDNGALPVKMKAWLYIGNYLSDVVAGNDGSGETTFDVTNINSEYVSSSVVEVTSITASSGYISGDLNVSGTINAQTLNIIQTNVQTITLTQSGSTSFGDDATDTHQFSGSIIVNGGGLTGSGGGLTDLRIGQPEDGVYNDGLFSFWTPETFVGTAIDRINEVLKGLAPQPAPDLGNIEYTLAAPGNQDQKLSFDDTTFEKPSGYTSVNGIGDLPAVNKDGAFSFINGPGGGKKRLGVYSSLPTTPIKLILNNDVSADGVNYEDDSFNTDENGFNTFKLYVNGNLVSTHDSSDFAPINSNNFNISESKNGKFNSSNTDFALWQHRSGSVTIPNSEWRNGYNYAQVSIQSPSTDEKLTTYVDWFFDTSASTDNYVINNASIVSETGQNEKRLSGIGYFQDIELVYNATVNKYYTNVYKTNAASFSINPPSTLTWVNPVAGLATDGPNTVFNVNTSFTGSDGKRVINDKIAITLALSNGLGKSATQAAIETQTMFFDSVGDSSSGPIETFTSETYRKTSTFGTWNSVDPAPNGSLIVTNGTLKAVSHAFGTANLSTIVSNLVPTGQPDYSGWTATEHTFYREFTCSNKQGFTLAISGAGFTRIGGNQNFPIPASDIVVLFKRTGDTLWSDSRIDFNTNLGSAITTISGQLIGGKGAGPNDIVLPNAPIDGKLQVLVIAKPTWQGNISNITLS